MSDHLPDTLRLTLSSHLELGKSRLQTLSRLIVGPIDARPAKPALTASATNHGFVSVSISSESGSLTTPIEPLISGDKYGRSEITPS